MKESNNIMCFFCDIRGTFSTISDNENSIKEFTDKIKRLGKINDSKEIIFSFITSDNISMLIENIQKIKPHIENNSIKMGSQFCEDAEINFIEKEVIPREEKMFNRAGIIIDSIKNIGIENVNSVFMADDVKLNIDILRGIWRSNGFDKDKLITFLPSGNKSLNECLDTDLLDKIYKYSKVRFKNYNER